MRHFCTAGPIQRDIHYYIPPLDRIDLPEVLSLIDARKYFILHAPRQTGKTSCMLALVDELNAGGRYKALYINVEGAQAVRNDAAGATRHILSVLATEAKAVLKDSIPDELYSRASIGAASDSLRAVLAAWAESSGKPICLIIDEADALVGDSLISLLRQLRAGYAQRPARFPSSVILCGVRDLRDYRIHGTQEVITGGSAFNIKAESLRLGDFSADDIRKLYGMHTAETGQQFEEGVFPLVWRLTSGQPWLVNALAYEACFRNKAARDRTLRITTEMIEDAKESLILRREVHLDQLTDKLKEDRVRRVVQPILAGSDQPEAASDDDVQYVIDLGLVRRGKEGLEIANAIYREVIPRELNFLTQLALETHQQTAWYVGPDGRLEMDKLLEAFQQFYRENAEPWLERFLYKESGPHLLLQAFLQRIVNGGGRIDREYGLGLRRIDLLVIWKYPGGTQRTVIELKMIRGSLDKTLKEGLAQTADYMRRVGTNDGHLVIFDPDPASAPDTRIFRRQEPGITVWGM